MTVISVSELALRFGVETVFENLSFSLNENDHLGIVGVNGCGKTSLLKLICGTYTPDAGQIYLSGNVSMGMVAQNEAFDEKEEKKSALALMYDAFPELQKAEKKLSELLTLLMQKGLSEETHLRYLNEYNECNSRYVAEGGLEYQARCASILKRMGYDEEAMARPVSELSGGQRTRLFLAKQLCREPDILLLDEPTNHLDMETLTWLESFLASYKKCLLVISHDRYFLDRVTGKTLMIENQRGRFFTGGYSEAVRKRDEENRVNEKHYKEQEKEIARQEAYIAQQRQFNRERNIIAAESRLKLLSKMERVERPKEAPRPIHMKFTRQFESGNDVLEVRNLAVGYNGQSVISDLNFSLKKGERAFIIGPNGCGKSTFIKTLIGKLPPVSGTPTVGYNVQVGYYDQENQNLTDANRVIDELWNAYPQKKENEIRNTLAAFRFVGEDVYKKVAVLSGGERARLTLAKLILSHMNLLVLDEPTNHLDIDSKEALESALSEFDGTILAVSHDRYFIDKLATRILAFRPGESFAGSLLDYPIGQPGRGYRDFSEYKARREAEREVKSATVQETLVSAGKEQYRQNKKELADARREQKRRERLAAESETLEKELTAIDKELYGPAASDYVRAAELQRLKDEKEERLMAIYEEIGV